MHSPRFDPKKLGKAEIEWWIAHNNKDKDSLLKFLILQNKLLYNITEDEAKMALSHLFLAVKAHDTKDWDIAVNLTQMYYEEIKGASKLTFDAQKVAELEVGWWKLHDELEFNEDKSKLVEMIADLYSNIFSIKKAKLLKAGWEKAEATREHDFAEDPRTPKDEVDVHWKKAENHLVRFYQELKIHLNNPL